MRRLHVHAPDELGERDPIADRVVDPRHHTRGALALVPDEDKLKLPDGRGQFIRMMMTMMMLRLRVLQSDDNDDRRCPSHEKATIHVCRSAECKNKIRYSQTNVVLAHLWMEIPQLERLHGDLLHPQPERLLITTARDNTKPQPLEQ
jgi:hypothetical protein